MVDFRTNYFELFEYLEGHVIGIDHLLSHHLLGLVSTNQFPWIFSQSVSPLFHSLLWYDSMFFHVRYLKVSWVLQRIAQEGKYLTNLFKKYISLKAIQDKKVVHNFEWLKKALFCQLMPVKLAWKSADKKSFF